MADDLAKGRTLNQAAVQPDVVVVGAGPAGSAAAIRLANAGLAVTVYERAVFPRRKVCGGCLSGDATDLLTALLGEAAFPVGQVVTQITFNAGRRSLRTSGGGRCRIVPRDILDLKLANAATAAGADFRFGAQAELVQENPGRFAIVANEQYLRPRWIIWAAGLTKLARKLFLEPAGGRRSLVGQAWTVSPDEGCPPPGHIAMHWLRGGYLGLATLSADACLLALAIEKNLPGGPRPWDALRAANSTTAVLERIVPPTAKEILGTAGFPHRPRRVGCGNLLVAGDAAGFEEPFSGEGIGQALRSGMSAAAAVIAGGRDELVVRRYGTLLRQHRGIRRRTRWLSCLLRSRVAWTLLDSPLPLPPRIGNGLLRRIHVKPTA